MMLFKGRLLSGAPTLDPQNGTGTWGYRVVGAGIYTGTANHVDLFEVDDTALSGGSYTGNPGDKDIFTLQIEAHDGSSTLTLNDGTSGGTVQDFDQLEIVAKRSTSSNITTFSPTNIAFGANTNIQKIAYYADSNDTLDIANLTGTPSVVMRDGNDTLTGVKAAHFDSTNFFDGGADTDSVTLTDTATANYRIGGGELVNFETVNFGAAEDVTWTLDAGDYTGTTAVTVNASGISGSLTFNASAEIEATVAFTVTGGAGADTFTGGASVDKYVYTTLAHSLAATHDTITDFTTTTDKFVVSATQFTAINTVTTGFVTPTVTGTGTLADDIATAITPAGMIAHGAALVTITGGSNAGTYLILNDNTAAFNAATDAVIQVTGTVVVVAGDFASSI